jgi:hypothetical protein
MTDVFDELEKLMNPEVPDYYVYYNPLNGTIVGIHRSYQGDEFPYIHSKNISIDVNEIDYIVIDQDGIKRIVKKQQVYNSSDVFTSIPVTFASKDVIISEANYTFDILFDQNNFEETLTIRLSGALRDQYQNNLNLKRKFGFYITADNDPNILYRSIIVSLSDLINNTFYKIDLKNIDDEIYSIFLKKYFTNYIHVVRI